MYSTLILHMHVIKPKTSIFVNRSYNSSYAVIVYAIVQLLMYAIMLSLADPMGWALPLTAADLCFFMP